MESKAKSQSKIFNAARANLGAKGWAVLFYLFVCFYLNTSINTCWQNIVPYWDTTYGWKTADMMSMNSIAQFVGIAVCFILGRVITRVSAKKMGIVVGLIVFLSMLAVPFITVYPLMLLAMCCAVIGNIVWAFTINPVFVSTWFPRKKGVVMGITTMGIPLGSGTCTKIAMRIIPKFGQNFGMSFSTVVALLGLILLIAVVKDNPTMAGYSPDNDSSLTMEDVSRMQRESDAIAAKSPWTTARMLKTPQTYILGLSIGCCALLGGGVNSTNMLRMLGMGYEQSFASNMMLFTALCACLASYLFGVLDAKKGPRFAMITVFVCAMGSAAFNFFASNTAMLVIGLMFTACVTGGAANFLTSLTIEYWGVPNFKRAYGVIYPIHQIPGSLGSMYMVQVAALFGGGYSACFVGLFIISLIALILFATIKDGSFVQKAEAKWASEK